MVLVVGPNPAVQRVLRFDALELGGVNRASGLDQYVGGKGQGAALALQLWAPEEGPHAVAQFLGGESGRYVESALAAAGLATITQQVAGPTRTCTTLLHDGGSNTELIDPSDAVTEAEVAGLTAQCAEVMRGYGVIAMCGTRP
jgi:1-phosphofructokinase